MGGVLSNLPTLTGMRRDGKLQDISEEIPPAKPQQPEEIPIEDQIFDENDLKSVTKIQACFRGHKARKELTNVPEVVPEVKQVKAVIKSAVVSEVKVAEMSAQKAEIESNKAEMEAEFSADDKELCHAATKIQASFRGHQVRKQTEKAVEKEVEDLSAKENNELPSVDITEDDIAGIPDPFQYFEQCLGESCEKEINAFVPSETFENPLRDLNSDPNAFLAERESVNSPNEQLYGLNNAEQPNNNNFPEFKPEYYQNLKTDFANEPNLEYNTFYNGRADTDPKERTNYANFDLKPEYNAEEDYLLPEKRSENNQNNRLRSANNYLPEARRKVSPSDFYDNRSGQGSPGSIQGRSGYSSAKSDYRNYHDSFNFGEGEDYHSEEFSDDSHHSDFYDVRNEEDHPDGFNVRSGSGKYDRIESSKKTDLPVNRYPSHRKLSPNQNPRKSEENQFDSMEDPTYKPYSEKIDILGKPKDRRPSNDYNYFKEPRKIITDFHDSSEEHDSSEVNINRRYQPDYVNHDDLYDTTRHENKIFPIPKSNQNYLRVLAKDPGVYATTHHGHEIFPIPKINKNLVRVLSKNSNNRDNLYDTSYHEDEIFPIQKSNKKYVTVLSKDSIHRDNLYDTTHHEDEIFPIPKSNKKYVRVLAKDSINRDNLYDTTHHEDEVFPIPKSYKKYVRVLAKHPTHDDLYDTTHHEGEIIPIPKSNKKYLTVLTKHDDLGDLYDTHHEDEIFPVLKSNKKYVKVLAKDSINHDDLYDTTHHEDEIFPIPKNNKKYLTVLAKHPIQRKPIRVENLPISKSYKKYLKFLRTGENPPGRGSGLRKYKYYDGEPNLKIMNQNMPKNHLAYIQTPPKEKDFSRTSNRNLHNDNSRFSKKYREKLKRLDSLYPNTHPIDGDSIRTNEKYISLDHANDPFGSEILASKFMSKKPKTQISKNYSNYLRRISQEYPDDVRERYNIKRILNKLEFHDDQNLDKHGDGLIEIPNDGKVFANRFYNTRIKQKTDKTTGNNPVNLFHLRQKLEKNADKKLHLSDEDLESLIEKYVRTNVARVVGSPEPNQKQKMDDLESLILEQYLGKIADDTTDPLLGEPDIKNHYVKIDGGVYMDPHPRLKTEESAPETKKPKIFIEPLPDSTLNRDSKRNESIVNQQPNTKPAKIESYNVFEDKLKNILEFLDHNQNQTSNEVERKTYKSEIMKNYTEGFQNFPSQIQNRVSTHENPLREESMNDTISASVSHVKSENNSLIEPNQKQKYNVSVRDFINEQNFNSKPGVSVDKPTSSDSLDQPLLGNKSLQSDGETKLQEKMDGEPKLRQNSNNSIEELGSEFENYESGRDAKFKDNSEDVDDEINLRNKSANEPNLNQKTSDLIDESNLRLNLNNSGDGTNAQRPFDDVLNNDQSEKSLDEPRDKPNFRKDSEKHVDKTNVSQNAFDLVDEPTLRDELKFDDGNNTKKLPNSIFEPGYKLEESIDKPNGSRKYEASLTEPNLRQSDDFIGEPKSKHNADIIEEPSNTDKPGNVNNEKGIRQSGEILDELKSRLNADVLDEPTMTDKPHKPDVGRKSDNSIDEPNQNQKNHATPDETKLRQHAEILLDKPSNIEKSLDPFYEHNSEESNMSEESLNSDDESTSDVLSDELNQNQKNHTSLNETKLRQHAEILLNKPSITEKPLDPFYEHKSEEPNMAEESLNSTDEPAYKSDDLIDEPNQNPKNHTPSDESNLKQHAEILLDKPSNTEKPLDKPGNTEKSLDPFYDPDKSEELLEYNSRKNTDFLNEPNMIKNSPEINDEPGAPYKPDDLIDEPIQTQTNHTPLDETKLIQHAEILLNKTSKTEKSPDLFYESHKSEELFEPKSRDIADILEEPNMTEKSINSNNKPGIGHKAEDLRDEPNSSEKTLISNHELVFLKKTNDSLDKTNIREKGNTYLNESTEGANSGYTANDLLDKNNITESEDFKKAPNLYNKSDVRQKGNAYLDQYNVREKPLLSNYKTVIRNKFIEILDKLNPNRKYQNPLRKLKIRENKNTTYVEPNVRQRLQSSNYHIPSIYNKTKDLVIEPNMMENTTNLTHESNIRQKSNESVNKSNVEEKPLNSKHELNNRQKSSEYLDEANVVEEPLNSSHEAETRQKSSEYLGETNVVEKPLYSSHETETQQKSSESLDETNVAEEPLNSSHEADTRLKSSESLDETNVAEEPLNSSHEADTRQKSSEYLNETNVVEEPLNSSHEADTRQKSRESLDESNIKEKLLNLNNESDIQQKSNESPDEFNALEKPLNSNHESDIRLKFNESSAKEKLLNLNNESDIRQKSNESLDEFNALEKPLNSNHESDIRLKFNESLDESSAKEKLLNLNNESDYRQKPNESLDESNALEKLLNSNHESDIQQKSNESLDESNAKEKTLISDHESNIRQKSNESHDEPNVNDKENFTISMYKSRFGEKEDEFPDEISLSDESGTLRKPNDLLDESPKYNHESGIRKKGDELPGESDDNREVFLDINPDIQNMVYNTAYGRDDLCFVDGKVSRGMDCLNTENDDVIVVSKRRFLDATQEFSNHYVLFLRSLAALYPVIIADGSEFMRLFKKRRDFQENFNDKSIEIHKTKMVDEIARQVIKSIYDQIELRLAKVKEDELNIETDSVNDNLLRTKPVQVPITTVPESKNPSISEEQTIKNNLEGAGKAYDSGDGRKAYNLGEERITIYNLGEKRQPNNKGAHRKAVDLEKKALILREEKIDKELEQERKIYHLGDEEMADNLGEGEDAGNIKDDEKSDNLREERKADDLGERRKAYESGEKRLDSTLEEYRKVNDLGESEKTVNLEDERAE